MTRWGLVVAAPSGGPGSDFGGAQTPPAPTGVLLLAHGGAPSWNERVLAVAKEANADPADRGGVRHGVAGVDAGRARPPGGARGEGVVAVPLFVSSHSSVITSTEYLLGSARRRPRPTWRSSPR